MAIWKCFEALRFLQQESAFRLGIVPSQKNNLTLGFTALKLAAQ